MCYIPSVILWTDMYLYVSDKRYFHTIRDAMKQIFNISVPLSQGYFEVDETHTAWFPQPKNIDGIIQAASSMKDAINHVGDQFGLPNGWLNSDFSQTGSYTPKLLEYSVYYKTFSNILTIRTVSAEYLIAMKLRSGRQYKNDLSDVLGVLAEHDKAGKPITMEQIKRAVDELYGSWSALPKNAADFIENAMNDGRFEALYTEVSEEEKATKTALIGFDQEYPGVTNESNVNDIIQGLRNRRGKKKTDTTEK